LKIIYSSVTQIPEATYKILVHMSQKYKTLITFADEIKKRSL